jgi:GNAT superfamily N-acetyltransferase
MTIREATSSLSDLEALLQLYTNLHEDGVPELDDKLRALWGKMANDPDHHVLLGEEGDILVSSCVLAVIPNLTRGQRPYGLIENVVTAEAYRGRGFASALLARAAAIAAGENCYKLMLLTGSKKESTLRFYERAGYNRVDKTGFIRWL